MNRRNEFLQHSQCDGINVNFDISDRLSEFANYLAANTQPQPITSSNLIMPPGDLQPLDASGLINLEPPQQPVIMVNNTGIIFNNFLNCKKYLSKYAN